MSIEDPKQVTGRAVDDLFTDEVAILVGLVGVIGIEASLRCIDIPQRVVVMYSLDWNAVGLVAVI